MYRRTAEEAADAAGRAIARGHTFCAHPCEDGWMTWEGDADGVVVKVERTHRVYGNRVPVLVWVAPEGK